MKVDVGQILLLILKERLFDLVVQYYYYVVKVQKKIDEIH